MRRQRDEFPFIAVSMAGVSLTDLGYKIPSPLVGISITNATVRSALMWELTLNVAGDASRIANIAAIEGLWYQAKQAAKNSGYKRGIPVSIILGWQSPDGQVVESMDIEGWTMQFDCNVPESQHLQYIIKGYGQTAVPANMPTIRIPPISGVVQPSAVLTALCEALKADTYYDLDIDRNDSPTFISHGTVQTSFTRYVRGGRSVNDNFGDFPGLQPLATNVMGNSQAYGLITDQIRNMGILVNNVPVGERTPYFRSDINDRPDVVNTFSFWVDEPTMTQRGKINFKSDAVLRIKQNYDQLILGGNETNIFSLSGSYNGVAYTLKNINAGKIGFTVDGTGNAIASVQPSATAFSASLADVFNSANEINNVNAIATQFSSKITITMAGNVRGYELAQPVTVTVLMGNTLSPISGIYRVMEVTQRLDARFITTLVCQRLDTGSANDVADGVMAGVSTLTTVSGDTSLQRTIRANQTSNIISPRLVELGTITPTFENLIF
jgi:hypothetical protein